MCLVLDKIERLAGLLDYTGKGKLAWLLYHQSDTQVIARNDPVTRSKPENL